ncbi:MAG: hypothetical protein WCT46_05890 [Candidatus Gracilibacteria bacterium]|jgi:hypothetical protein
MKKHKEIIITFVITSVLVGGGIFLWKDSEANHYWDMMSKLVIELAECQDNITE